MEEEEAEVWTVVETTSKHAPSRISFRNHAKSR